MRICFIAPGEIEIPPKNWGALENVVWSLSQELEKLGHEMLIVNEIDINDTHQKIKKFNPDVLHLHYGKHWELMPQFNCKKIATSYDGSFEVSNQFHEFITRKYLYDCSFFCLREFEKDFFLNIGISPSKTKIIPLGTNPDSFKINLSNPSKKDRSIYLGKIDDRKRQFCFQKKGIPIDFVGPNASPKFDPLDESYLGVWTEKEKFENLTEYGNLVLLSVSENGNPPLVCLEAMCAGLGIVVSEASNEGIDLNRKFISVIPEDKINDLQFLKEQIDSNREYSIKNRSEIIEYGHQRSWLNVAKIYEKLL
jgi:glycosyltransferase involved in cell wall biosynthesis